MASNVPKLRRAAKWILGLCLVCGVLAFVAKLTGLCADPKTARNDNYLIGWLAELREENSVERRKLAQSVVQGVGTNALPFLLKRMAYKRSGLENSIARVISKFWPGWLSNEAEVRMDAVMGFQVFGVQAAPAIPELAVLLTNKSIPESAFALAALGPESSPILVDALKHPNKEIRRAAAHGLGKLGTNAIDCVMPLLGLTNDEDWSVRAISVWALGEMGPSPSTIQAFIARLQDTNVVVRKFSAEALGKLGGASTSAIPALEKTKQDSYAYVSNQAVLSLEIIRTASVEKLTNQLNSTRQRTERAKNKRRRSFSITNPSKARESSSTPR